MLTARTKDGNKICLGIDYQKEALIKLRTKEEFYCPICEERVLLKLGDQRIFHFAHKRGGNCQDVYENESVYHMQGKRQLYQWLLRQNIPAILEFYDPDIQQRPDIMFEYKGKKYALEYQCTTISEEIFQKRTENYFRQDYIPFWIIGGKQLHHKKQNIAVLSNFHYLFLRQAPDGSFYIPAFCPEMRLFHIIGSILPYSIKNTFVQNCFYSIEKAELSSLLKPTIMSQLNFRHWNDEIERFKLNRSLHPDKRDMFLHEIYHKNLNLSLLPPEIGLPVYHSPYIQTSPVIWQAYLYIDILAKKKPGDFIYMEEIEQYLFKRIKRKEILIRNLPQIQEMKPLKTVLDYISILEKLEVLSRESKWFQLKKNFNIPRSNREKEEMSQLFFQKYLQQHAKR